MKRKININRPEISPEEISKRKDFDTVLKHHTGATKPFFKKPIFLSSVLVTVAAIVTTVVLLTKSPSNNHPPELAEVQQPSIINEQSSIINHPCINPPLKEINIPFTSFKVTAEKGGTLDFKTGSKLIIPKNAFADAQGKPLTGEIELRYREFHDAADFFVSGIPMTYDSAGNKYQFESAGMMEMQGYKDGEKVTIAKGKSIAIEMASPQKGTEYNLYKLDTAHNNWSCLGKDKVTKEQKQNGSGVAGFGNEQPLVTTEQRQELQKIETKKEVVVKEKETRIAALPKPAPEPRKPVLAKNDKRTFDIAVEDKEFPELDIYKGVLFEIGQENKDFNPAYYDITWDDASLKDGPKKGINYALTLKKGLKTYGFIVYPVFEGKDYESAQKTYQDKFSKYTATLDKRKADEKRIEEEYQARIIAFNKQQEDLMQEWKKQQAERFKQMEVQDKVSRLFSIASFGIYNSDCPKSYPQGVLCTATLIDKKNVPLDCYNIYLVDKARTALFTYYKNPVEKFTFNPKSTNMLWTVVNGELYWLKPEEFKDIKENGKVMNLVLDKVEEKFTTVEDLKAFFHF